MRPGIRRKIGKNRFADTGRENITKRFDCSVQDDKGNGNN